MDIKPLTDEEFAIAVMNMVSILHEKNMKNDNGTLEHSPVDKAQQPELVRRVWLSGEEAEWLADKIVGANQYGNDAANMLRRLAGIEQDRDMLLAAFKVNFEEFESDKVRAEDALKNLNCAIAEIEGSKPK